MNYIQWNNLIGDYLFSIDNYGKLISLYLNEDDVFEIGSSTGGFPNNERKTILEDFKTAFKRGPQSNPNVTSLIDKINSELILTRNNYSEGSGNLPEIEGSRYPLYLMHLTGIICALASDDDAMNMKIRGRYERIRQYYAMNEGEFPNMNEKSNWNGAWDHILRVVNKIYDGKYGNLNTINLSALALKYFNKPYAYLLLNRKELKILYKKLYEDDTIETKEIADEQIKSIFLECINKYPQSRNNYYSNLIKDKEASKQFLFLLKDIIQGWDKTYIEEADEANHKLPFRYRRVTLKLILQLNSITGELKPFLSFYSEEPLPDELLLNGIEVSLKDHWARPFIPVNENFISDSFKIKSNLRSIKAVFKMTDVIVLKHHQIVFGIDTYAQIENIEKKGKHYIIIKENLQNALQEWIVNNRGTQKSTSFDKFGTRTYVFTNGFNSEFTDIRSLRFQNNKRASLTGGLKGNGRGVYIVGYPFRISVEGADGEEKFILKRNDIVIGTYGLEPEMNYTSEINIQEPGEYILESVNGAQISLFNNGKLILEENGTASRSVNLETTDNNLFGAKDRFSITQNIVINTNPGELPENSIDARESVFDKIAIKFLEYLNYRSLETEFKNGVKGVFENYLNNIPDLELGNINEIIRNSQFNYFNSLRLQRQYDNKGNYSGIRPIAPFIIRLPNIFDLNIHLNAARPFKGALYTIGGIYSNIQLGEIIESAKIDNGAKVFTYSEIVEKTDNGDKKRIAALNVPAIFIYEKHDSTFINVVKNILNCDDPKKYYEYFSNIQNIEDIVNSLNWEPNYFNDYETEGDNPKIFDFEMLGYKTLKNVVLQTQQIAAMEFSYQAQKLGLVKNKNAETGRIEYAKVQHHRWTPYVGLKLLGRNTMAIKFNSADHTLLVPMDMRLPFEIEKCLYLASGRLPSYKMVNGVNYITYPGLYHEKDTIKSIMDLLNQKIEEININ